jgi:hypothetical protein
MMRWSVLRPGWLSVFRMVPLAWCIWWHADQMDKKQWWVNGTRVDRYTCYRCHKVVELR